MRTPRAQGFTFLGLLFLIAIMGVMAAAAATTFAFTSQRDKEQDLLYVGRAYRLAIRHYRQAHATRPQPYPTALEQLLDDSDRLAPRRHLRRLFFDPMTGSPQWGLERNAQGGITGVYSLCERRPVRTTSDVPDETIAFGAARSYRDWVFSALDHGSTEPAAARAPAAVPDDDARPLTPGRIPGWNYDRDGEPPLQWTPEHPRPQAPASPG
jgi:type II secretory pathway pseudopilin PulG